MIHDIIQLIPFLGLFAIVAANEKHIHMNKAQLPVFYINPAITVIFFGRGTGKTTFVSSIWIYLRILSLPRSTGAIFSTSYRHLIDTVIPALQVGWSKIGLVEGTHYWISEKPPKKKVKNQPYTAVPKKEAKHYIYFVNGAVIKMTSGDRSALFNSASFDWGVVFEGKKQSKQVVMEDFFPMIRGGEENKILENGIDKGKTFKDVAEHGSFLLESDLPKYPKERWILGLAKEHDEQTVMNIISLKAFIHQLEQKMNESKIREKKRIQEAIDKINTKIDEARKYLTAVFYGSTLDNIHALGIKAIAAMKAKMEWNDYQLFVLNKMVINIDNCFYEHLDRDKHGYYANNYDYIDLHRQSKRNWKWDSDFKPSSTIDISIDKNYRISCLVASQRIGNRRKILKSFHVLAPKEIQHVVDEFIEYYKGVPNLKTRFIYNNTFVGGKKHGLESTAMLCMKQLRNAGISVEDVYLGQAYEHDLLFDKYKELYTGQLSFEWVFNIDNNEEWYHSCKNTEVKEIKGQNKKNKTHEQNMNIPAIECPHLSEASDQLFQYDLVSLEKTNKWESIGGYA